MLIVYGVSALEFYFYLITIQYCENAKKNSTSINNKSIKILNNPVINIFQIVKTEIKFRVSWMCDTTQSIIQDKL